MIIRREAAPLSADGYFRTAMQKPAPLILRPLLLLCLPLVVLLGCHETYQADAPLRNVLLQMEAQTPEAPPSASPRYAVYYQLRGNERFPVQSINAQPPYTLVRRLRSGDTLVFSAVNVSGADLLPDSLAALRGGAADSAARALGLDALAAPMALRIRGEDAREVLRSDSTAAQGDSLHLQWVVEAP